MWVGVQTEICKECVKFATQTRKRLKSQFFIGSPQVHTINHDKKLVILIRFIDLLPVNPYMIGIPGLIVMLVIWGVNWGLIVPGLITLAGLFTSRYFVILLLYLGLKKQGYKGKIKFMSTHNMLDLARWY